MSEYWEQLSPYVVTFDKNNSSYMEGCFTSTCDNVYSSSYKNMLYGKGMLIYV